MDNIEEIRGLLDEADALCTCPARGIILKILSLIKGLEKDNEYVAAWMDKVHELGEENAKLKAKIEGLEDENKQQADFLSFIKSGRKYYWWKFWRTK